MCIKKIALHRRRERADKEMWWILREQRLLPFMAYLDPIVFRELPVIQKILADNMRLEGERRGAHVSPHDPIVQERVCDIILCIGEKLREMFQGSASPDSCRSGLVIIPTQLERSCDRSSKRIMKG